MGGTISSILPICKPVLSSTRFKKDYRSISSSSGRLGLTRPGLPKTCAATGTDNGFAHDEKLGRPLSRTTFLRSDQLLTHSIGEALWQRVLLVSLQEVRYVRNQFCLGWEVKYKICDPW